ncbi:hypothetical protein CCE29_00315 [Lacticaseibacillus rhamnosus]|nr:hypothetical protein CCE29_00315 [Lacticaseibacillus rhamnosus]
MVSGDKAAFVSPSYCVACVQKKRVCQCRSLYIGVLSAMGNSRRLNILAYAHNTLDGAETGKWGLERNGQTRATYILAYAHNAFAGAEVCV